MESAAEGKQFHLNDSEPKPASRACASDRALRGGGRLEDAWWSDLIWTKMENGEGGVDQKSESRIKTPSIGSQRGVRQVRGLCFVESTTRRAVLVLARGYVGEGIAVLERRHLPHASPADAEGQLQVPCRDAAGTDGTRRHPLGRVGDLEVALAAGRAAGIVAFPGRRARASSVCGFL